MKAELNFDEHTAMKEKRIKKMESKNREKTVENNSEVGIEVDDINLLLKKKTKNNPKSKNSSFRNNYKNYQYDYEEDFYEPY
ncbi:hypothetical protein [Metaclostridioides mangenotii]|uniref:hypothetical protein n=1 Tax=Metaclostridioides mangenotii TaxID=1540 RepID=UPI0004634B9C|nr:hypothetical protein [Clostridioides mangenotii]